MRLGLLKKVVAPLLPHILVCLPLKHLHFIGQIDNMLSIYKLGTRSNGIGLRLLSFRGLASNNNSSSVNEFLHWMSTKNYTKQLGHPLKPEDRSNSLCYISRNDALLDGQAV